MKATLIIEFNTEEERSTFEEAQTHLKVNALTPKDERLVTPERLITGFIRRVNRYLKVPPTTVIPVKIEYTEKNIDYDITCTNTDAKHEHPICSHDICEDTAVAQGSDNGQIYAWCLEHMQRTDVKLACIEITKKFIEETEQC